MSGESLPMVPDLEESRQSWAFPLWWGRLGSAGALAGLFWNASGVAGPPAWFMLAFLAAVVAGFAILAVLAQGMWERYNVAVEAQKEDEACKIVGEPGAQP